jgi:hypothetical protein
MPLDQIASCSTGTRLVVTSFSRVLFAFLLLVNLHFRPDRHVEAKAQNSLTVRKTGNWLRIKVTANPADIIA